MQVSQTEKSGIGKGKAAKVTKVDMCITNNYCYTQVGFSITCNLFQAKNDDFMLEIGPIPPLKTTLPCETTDKVCVVNYQLSLVIIPAYLLQLSVTEMLSSNDEEFNYSDFDALVCVYQCVQLSVCCCLCVCVYVSVCMCVLM